MPDNRGRDELVKSGLRLVHFIAWRRLVGCPSSVDVEDLVGEGCVALIRAADRFEPARNVPFGVYAYKQVWGAITSYIRSQSKHFSDRQLEVIDAGDDPEPQNGRLDLRKYLAVLSAQERAVITMYYYDDLTLERVGRRLGLSGSRVHQIHVGALEKMRRVADAPC